MLDPARVGRLGFVLGGEMIRRFGAALIAVLGLGCSAGGEPGITNVEPRQSPASGEQPVRIHGHDFRTDIGYTVYFGSERSEEVFIEGPESIVAVAPRADKAGPVDIYVMSDDGAAWVIKKAFEYKEAAGGQPADPTKRSKLVN